MTTRSSGRRALRAAAAAVGVTAVVLTAFPGTASADAFDDGQWYYTNFHMADNHTVADGSGVKIALIDTAIDPSVPELAGTKLVTQPASVCERADGSKYPDTATGSSASHATDMAVMMIGNGKGTVDGRGAQGVAPGATVLHYAIGFPGSRGPLTCDQQGGTYDDGAVSQAIDDAVQQGARIISMSFGGSGGVSSQFSAAQAEHKGVVLVAASDDATTPSDPSRIQAPGGYNGVVLVNAITSQSQLPDYSAKSPLVVVASPGDAVSLGATDAAGTWQSGTTVSGSSPATAWTSAVLAVLLSKYPKATGNQLIQSLIRNTGAQQHDPYNRAPEGFGFGVPSLTSMLRTDPTTYPDVNPLLRDGAVPSTADIVGTPSASASPSDGPSSGSASSGSSSPTPVAAPRTGSGSSTGLWIGIAAAILVLAVIVVVAVVILRRRSGSRAGPGAPPPPAPGY